MTTEVFGIESPWVLLAFSDDIYVVGNTVIMERDPKLKYVLQRYDQWSCTEERLGHLPRNERKLKCFEWIVLRKNRAVPSKKKQQTN